MFWADAVSGYGFQGIGYCARMGYKPKVREYDYKKIVPLEKRAHDCRCLRWISRIFRHGSNVGSIDIYFIFLCRWIGAAVLSGDVADCAARA
jgi:hypothetical protein